MLLFPVGPRLLWDSIHIIVARELTEEHFLGYAGSLYDYYIGCHFYSFIYTFSQKKCTECPLCARSSDGHEGRFCLSSSSSQST